jgi:integrase
MEAYQAALSGAAPSVALGMIGASRTVGGTVDSLVKAYLDCSSNSTSLFKTLAAETQRTRRNILENFTKGHGDMRIFRTEANGRKVMLMARHHVQRMVNAKAATPFAQRNFLNTLRAMFAWAVGEGRVPVDPTVGITRTKAQSTGHKTWSDAEIERFEAKHPIGSKARLAFALLLYAGARKSDVIAMGPQHVHNGVLTFNQRKVRGRATEQVEMPVLPKLAEIIAATPSGHLTFLMTSFGKPYTAAGFGNWFREMCDAAGCPDVSAHGLRKAMASHLADKGASDHQIMAVTGHASATELARYTAAANRKRMARQAMTMLTDHDGT